MPNIYHYQYGAWCRIRLLFKNSNSELFHNHCQGVSFTDHDLNIEHPKKHTNLANKKGNFHGLGCDEDCQGQHTLHTVNCKRDSNSSQ